MSTSIKVALAFLGAILFVGLGIAGAFGLIAWISWSMNLDGWLFLTLSPIGPLFLFVFILTGAMIYCALSEWRSQPRHHNEP